MRRKLAVALFIAWTLVMVFLLLSPGTEIPKFKLFEHQDKVAHLVLFGGWCFLFVLSLKKSSLSATGLVFFTGLILAGITEWLQTFIPYRMADWYDFSLDLVGVIFGVILGFFTKKELMGTEKKFDK